MSKTIQINSASQLSGLLTSSRIVVIDFYADWCGPCKQIAPIFEQLSAQLSRPHRITFTKVDTDAQPAVTATHGVNVMPTFVIFKQGAEVARIRGANVKALGEAVKKLAAEAEGGGGGGEGGFAGASGAGAGGGWVGVALPRNLPYENVTGQVDVRGLDLLNADTDFGGARTLFESGGPAALEAREKGKGKSKAAASSGAASSTGKDWVESDTDPQLMLYIPFQSTLRIHSLQITSLPPRNGDGGEDGDDDDDEIPNRPRTIKLYTNRAHNLGFDEAEDFPCVQQLELKASDWDQSTGTARLDLRFVKFQNVMSLVMFVVDNDGESERTRIDRVRIVGESGEKRDMGKLEKIGDEQGE